MSREAPLVYCSERARRTASRLFPEGVVVETLIAQRISHGAVRQRQGNIEVRGPGWRAIGKRRPGRVRISPRAWVICDIEAVATTTLPPHASKKKEKKRDEHD
jgi:hypothetical protein